MADSVGTSQGLVSHFKANIVGGTALKRSIEAGVKERVLEAVEARQKCRRKRRHSVWI